MKNKGLNSMKIVLRVLLCISLIVAVSLLLNYVKNLNPAQDGFSVSDLMPRIIHGDDYWTWEKLQLDCIFRGLFLLLYFALIN